VPSDASKECLISTFSSARRAARADSVRFWHSWNPDLDTFSQAHI